MALTRQFLNDCIHVSYESDPHCSSAPEMILESAREPSRSTRVFLVVNSLILWKSANSAPPIIQFSHLLIYVHQLFGTHMDVPRPFKPKLVRSTLPLIFWTEKHFHLVSFKSCKNWIFFLASSLSSSLPNHFRSFCTKNDLIFMKKCKTFILWKCSGNDSESHNLALKKKHHVFSLVNSLILWKWLEKQLI